MNTTPCVYSVESDTAVCYSSCTIQYVYVYIVVINIQGQGGTTLTENGGGGQ